MKLNKTQLKIIELVADKIEAFPREIALNLGISRSLVSKHLSYLIQLGFLEKTKKRTRISQKKFARILSNLITDDDTLIEDLANESLPLLMAVIEKEGASLKEIAREIKLCISSIYPYIRKLLKRGILYKKDSKILFNRKLWPELYEFISLYKSDYILAQFKIPPAAKIYYESFKEIIFSLNTEFASASKTAFSLYDVYWIKLMEKEIFYRLPKKKLSIQTIFLDSLRIAGAKGRESTRRRAYSYLFYRKNNLALKKISHPDLTILKDITQGVVDANNFPDFPSRQELIQMGENYDIKI